MKFKSMKEKQINYLRNTPEQKLFFDGSIPPKTLEEALKESIKESQQTIIYPHGQTFTKYNYPDDKELFNILWGDE